jgi:hypothetical protein
VAREGAARGGVFRLASHPLAPVTVVLGLGGYVSFPGGLMARLLGRPLTLDYADTPRG